MFGVGVSPESVPEPLELLSQSVVVTPWLAERWLQESGFLDRLPEGQP